MGADVHVFTTTSLGDNSFLLSSGSDAVLVDPQRDAWRFVDAARFRGLTVQYVLETHVHNDYVSGALEVRAATGAEIGAPAGGGNRFPHRRLAEGDRLEVGAMRLQVMETPGHTPEHLSYLILEEGVDVPVGVLTGGSLIVGGAGRTDLLGPERTEELARAQFRSLRRLATLPGETEVLPTHGAGSFCGTAAPHRGRTSTISRERGGNPALLAPDEEAFLRAVSGLPRFPAYYRHMAEANRSGPDVLGDLPELRPRSPDDVARRLAAGTWLVDCRDRLSFAASHVPGAINVELDDAFATYVGWVVPFGAPLILVLPEAEGARGREALTQLLRVGYDRVEGYLEGGIDAWRHAGRPVNAYPTADVDELCGALRNGDGDRVVDVRQPVEWEEGVIDASMRVFLGDLPERLDELPRDRRIWTICRSGYRAAIAASLLDRARVPVGLVARDGVSAFLARCEDRREGGPR